VSTVGGKVFLKREIKRVWREADHSPRTSAEVENGGAKPPLPPKSSCLSILLIFLKNNFIVTIANVM
jgi:hypothetical protein